MEQPLEYQFCSHCRDHAVFEEDEQEGWMSVCCFAKPIDVDVELDDFDIGPQRLLCRWNRARR